MDITLALYQVVQNVRTKFTLVINEPIATSLVCYDPESERPCNLRSFFLYLRGF